MPSVRLLSRLIVVLLAPLLLRAQAVPVRSELLGMALPDSTTITRNPFYREAAKYSQRLDASRLHRALGARQEVFRLVLSAPAQSEFLQMLRVAGWMVTIDPALATAAIVEKAGSPPVLLTFVTSRKDRWLYATDITAGDAAPGAPSPGSPAVVTTAAPNAIPPAAPSAAPLTTSPAPTALPPSAAVAPPVTPTSAAAPEPNTSAPPPPAPGTGSFAFNTTTFDDGWTSKIGPDFVTITKGDISVVQHYKREEENKYMSVLEEQTRLFWELLVAPRYRDVADVVVERNNPGGYEPINVASATATERATGRRVYLVLFNHPNRNTHWLEFVTPDQATFEREFGPYRGSDTNWAPWIGMASRNRFGVAPSDFVGTWSDNFASATSMVFAATGRAAGMLYAGGNTTVAFDGGTYRMDVSSGSGMTGSVRFKNVTYTGAFRVLDNWTIEFANNFEGKARRFRAAFEGIRDGRVLSLVLDEPGPSGITLHMIRVR